MQDMTCKVESKTLGLKYKRIGDYCAFIRLSSSEKLEDFQVLKYGVVH